jgi:hypothetical protein
MMREYLRIELAILLRLSYMISRIYKLLDLIRTTSYSGAIRLHDFATSMAV